jgi:hypothetical protein
MMGYSKNPRIEANLMGSSFPSISRINLINADTQYEITLKPGCKQFLVRIRPDPAIASPDFRIYFEKEGEYLTVSYYYDVLDIELKSKLLFWSACSTANQVLEVVQWV